MESVGRGSGRMVVNPQSIRQWSQIGNGKFYKGRSQEKNFSRGWNFSCFAAHLMERDLF